MIYIHENKRVLVGLLLKDINSNVNPTSISNVLMFSIHDIKFFRLLVKFI